VLKIENLHGYQVRAVNHVLEHPHSFLWLFLGAGKTVIGLTAFSELQRQGFARGMLVLGPLRVVQAVWVQEARKWDHLKRLRFSLVHGTPEARIRALFRPADVYLMNYENLPWLAAQLQHYCLRANRALPFDVLLADESTKLKNAATKRMEALVPLLRYFRWRIGLTGTPASNGLEDLFGQFLVIDGGKRLGIDYEDYLRRFFQPEGYGGYKYTATPEGEREISRRVSDVVLQMNQEDYLKLPKLITQDLFTELPERHRAAYDALENELFVELDNGEVLEVANEAAKVNKLLQVSNGAAYTDTETRDWSPIHDAKLELLDSIIEEASGEPVLLAYNYRPDAYRILKRYPFAKNLTGMPAAEFEDALQAWKDGRERLLIGHPASLAHGVDGLQDSCNTLVWFGLGWSLELYLQFVARIHRQGQERPVVCHRLLCRDTFDEVVRDALEMKTFTQDALRRAVDEYRKRRERKAA